MTDWIIAGWGIIMTLQFAIVAQRLNRIEMLLKARQCAHGHYLENDGK